MPAASVSGILGALGELGMLAAEAASSISEARSKEIKVAVQRAMEKYLACLLDFDAELDRHNREAAERIAALPLGGPVAPTPTSQVKVRLRNTDIVFYASLEQLAGNPDKLERVE